MTEDDQDYLVTLTPKEQTVTVWGKIEYTVSKEPLLPKAQVFYDEDGTRVRELIFSNPKTLGGRLMPSVMEMKPLNKEGHRTLIIYDDINFDVPAITDQTFSLRNLKKRF